MICHDVLHCKGTKFVSKLKANMFTTAARWGMGSENQLYVSI